MAAMAAAAVPSDRPPLPWRARLLVGAVSVLHSASLRRDGTVNRFLLSLFDRVVPPNPAPDAAGVASSDHAVSDDLRVRMFFPGAAARDGGGDHLPVVVYFHGGGFVFHSVASAQFDALCRRFASAIPAVVASVDFRLAPEHRFPAPYDDGEAALRWVLAGAGGALPSPPATVFVAGDSAAATSPTTSSPARRAACPGSSRCSRSSPARRRPPPSSGSATRRSGRRADILAVARVPPTRRHADHEAANVPAALRRDAERRRAFPPTMVCVGGWDAHQDRQRDYANALRAAGGAEEVVVAEFPDAIHAFYIFDDLADSKRLLTEVTAFVNRRRAAAAAS